MFDLFGPKDAIDILLVAILLYYIWRLMKASGSLNVFYGILIFVAVWSIVAQILQMKLIGSIFETFRSVGVIALIILFQEEIRRFFLTLGSQRRLSKIAKLFKQKITEQEVEQDDQDIMRIVLACNYMSKNLVGALIIIEREMSLTDIVISGEKIDAIISSQLIKNIFFKNSPLHDGAMIISHNRIAAAGCILPVSHNLNIPKDLGLRHRAALGISQQSDAIAIIVSEETGAISVAQGGEFHLRFAGNELESYLANQLKK
ncbi:MAG: diadenylate cyclase CdaA [Bacteroidaceae bacterium]|nr:diadenylate cyclase CdaA [Bacteroidaceae bacterium]